MERIVFGGVEQADRFEGGGWTGIVVEVEFAVSGLCFAKDAL